MSVPRLQNVVKVERANKKFLLITKVAKVAS